MTDPHDSARIISLSEHIDLQALEAYELLGRAVRPICLTTGRGEPLFWGSGVLLQLAGEHFLATAAHVIHEVSDSDVPHGAVPGTIVTFGSEKHVELHGRIHRTVPITGKEPEFDRVDVALLELSPEEVAQIDDAHFLTSQDIDVRDHLVPRRLYFFLGLPGGWQKRNLPAASLKVKPYPFIGKEVQPEHYQLLDYPREQNLAISFDAKRTSSGGKEVASPDPHGTSGGGFWRIDETFAAVSEQRPPSLVALMTKHYPKAEKALLAVRVSVVVQLLGTARPDLVASLPDVSWLPKLERWCTLPGAFHTIDASPAA
jgi:hypothetical protein